MRDFFRYLLVLSVLGLGFYGALQHRLTDDLPNAMGELAELEMPLQSTDLVESAQAGRPVEVIPLAALLDEDRGLSHEAQPKPPEKPTHFPKIGRQSTRDHNAHVDDKSAGPAEQVAVAEESAANAQTLAAKTPVATPKCSEGDPPRPCDPPRNGLAADTESSSAARFPLPKLAIRPGHRFALPDPIEPDPFSTPEESPSMAPPGDQLEAAAPDSDDQIAADDAPPDALIHQVQPGDTLPKLAERYLGDRDKYRAIFEANSQILPDPRLLPIGVDLAIPAFAAANITDKRPNRPSDNTPWDDPLDDLFAPSARSERSGNLEPIPPQALPKLPFDARSSSIR